MKKNILSIICLVAIMILFATTNPYNVPSLLLILPFFLSFLLLFSVIFPILRKNGMPLVRSVRIAMLSCSVPILLMFLQSVGQLTLRDCIALFAFIILSLIYIWHTKPFST